jgi:hypothetical protein
MCIRPIPRQVRALRASRDLLLLSEIVARTFAGNVAEVGSSSTMLYRVYAP